MPEKHVSTRPASSLVTSGDRYKIVLAYNAVLRIKHGRNSEKN